MAHFLYLHFLYAASQARKKKFLARPQVIDPSTGDRPKVESFLGAVFLIHSMTN